ncbi:hypothetical protein PG994_012777 [Apiospora phragmitis]|uniref:Uncharacterized protein n=1 Tax=Apiospora phragmitis TaxID=2905665 RepID=A0ABR1TDT4_9PEZI
MHFSHITSAETNGKAVLSRTGGYEDGGPNYYLTYWDLLTYNLQLGKARDMPGPAACDITKSLLQRKLASSRLSAAFIPRDRETDPVTNEKVKSGNLRLDVPT